MRAIGRLTALVAALVALGAAVVGIRSVPDVKRYLKMRQM